MKILKFGHRSDIAEFDDVAEFRAYTSSHPACDEPHVAQLRGRAGTIAASLIYSPVQREMAPGVFVPGRWV